MLLIPLKIIIVLVYLYACVTLCMQSLPFLYCLIHILRRCGDQCDNVNLIWVPVSVLA